MLFTVLAVMGLKGIGYAINTQSGRTYANKSEMYKDGNGGLRLNKNGKRIADTWDNNGDQIIKYISDGTTVRNLTKEQSVAREKEAIIQGKRFYLRQPDTGCRGKLGVDTICGERYCEVGKPNTYYVKRMVIYNSDDNNDYVGIFYMDMNCNLICPTEEQIETDKRNHNIHNYKELYNEIIQEWKTYVSSPYTNVKYNYCYMIGKTNKADYKSYSDKITRWKQRL